MRRSLQHVNMYKNSTLGENVLMHKAISSVLTQMSGNQYGGVGTRALFYTCLAPILLQLGAYVDRWIQCSH